MSIKNMKHDIDRCIWNLNWLASSIDDMKQELVKLHDVQEQYAIDWDLDRAEYLRVLGRVAGLERRVFWTTTLVVCLVMERICVYCL
jgi:hypothetical protein